MEAAFLSKEYKYTHHVRMDFSGKWQNCVTGDLGNPATNIFSGFSGQDHPRSHQQFLEISVTIIFGVGIARIQGGILAACVIPDTDSTYVLVSSDAADLTHIAK